MPTSLGIMPLPKIIGQSGAGVCWIWLALAALVIAVSPYMHADRRCACESSRHGGGCHGFPALTALARVPVRLCASLAVTAFIFDWSGPIIGCIGSPGGCALVS